jgi:RNA polymerase primary sigma factor
LPLNKIGNINQVKKAAHLLEQEFEREPTPEEIAEYLAVPVEEVNASLLTTARHISFDCPFSEEDDITLMDVFENKNAPSTDESLVNFESLHIEIRRSLKALSERQKEVICFFYGIGIDHPLSLEDIGERYSLTRERVRQIKEKAITKLRSIPACNELKSFLG